MKSIEKQEFAKMLEALGEYYGKPITPAVVSIYWNGLSAYSLDEVKTAFNLHAKNPDSGQFMPKIADVEKFLHGNTSTQAMQAWLIVYNAVQQHGTYRSVSFDDPLINQVVMDMGGWPAIGLIDDDELPFKIREFEKRYMAYLQKKPDAPAPYLLGVAAFANRKSGQTDSAAEPNYIRIACNTPESEKARTRKQIVQEFTTEAGLQP